MIFPLRKKEKQWQLIGESVLFKNIEGVLANIIPSLDMSGNLIH